MTVRIAMLVLVVLITGCHADSEVLDVGARKLPGTEDLRKRFSVSPRGSWLLYSREVDRAGAFSLALVRLDDETHHEIDITDQVMSAIGDSSLFLVREAHWDRHERAVVFPVDEYLGGEPVEIVFDAAPYRLTPVDDLDAWDLVEPPRIEVVENPHQPDLEFVEVEQDRHWLSLAVDGHPIAEHRSSGLLRTQLFLDVVTPSPDRRFLAYAMQRSHVLNAGKPAFIVPVDGSSEPLYLGSAVSAPIVWDPVRPRLYANALVGGRRAVYVWQLDKLFPDVAW